METGKATYIFDLDGTLVDSMDVAVGVLLGILESHSISYSNDIVKTIVPLGFRGVADYYIKTFALKESSEEIYAEIIDRLVYEYSNRVQPKQTVEKTLRELKAQGFSLNILTASAHELIDPCIQRLGWGNLFDNIWSAEDFNLKKSEPYVFLEAAKKLGVDPGDCWMVDDNLIALTSAKKAGLKVAGVYDSYSNEYVKEIREIADAYLGKMEEILSLDI